jgi:hypothetical protein
MNEIVDALNRRNVVSTYCINILDAKEKILKLVDEKKPKDIGVFGSISVRSIGILDILREKGNIVYDPYSGKFDLEDEILNVKMKCLEAELVFMSVNALTRDGIIINVDGLGNRVCSMMLGPRTVVIVAGKNKIVDSIDKGIQRVKDIAAPLNAKRLNIHTPCYYDKGCVNCKSSRCICRYTLIMEQQKYTNRMYLFLVGENLGY